MRLIIFSFIFHPNPSEGSLLVFLFCLPPRPLCELLFKSRREGKKKKINKHYLIFLCEFSTLTRSHSLSLSYVFMDIRRKQTSVLRENENTFNFSGTVSFFPAAGDAIDATVVVVSLRKIFLLHLKTNFSDKQLMKLENVNLLKDVDHVFCFVMIEICMNSSMFAHFEVVGKVLEIYNCK